MAGIAGLGGFCSQSVESEEVADHADRPSDQGEGGFGINIFGLSLHTDRSAGHNEVNPGVGLRYVFGQPAPRWALFGETSIYYDSSGLSMLPSELPTASPNAGALELPLLTDKVEATTMESRSSP
jgi:hypothetical protein